MNSKRKEPESKQYLNTLKKAPYGNWKLLAPNGSLLCRCHDERIEWYVSRNLATIVPDEPFTVRLNFEPSGNGHADDPFYLQERKNHCVCCGTEEDLTKHHCVPFCYRKYFPESIKSRSSHDVLCICVKCHGVYESHATKLKAKILEEFDIPPECIDNKPDRELDRVRRNAVTLKRYADRIPQERVELLLHSLRKYFSKNEINAEDIETACEINTFIKQSEYKNSSEYVVAHLEDIEDFSSRWRQHFIDCMKPAHLPQYWTVDRRNKR